MRDNDLQVEFRILGPVEASVGGHPLPIGGPKQRAILAALLLRANEVVPRDQLIDDVWGDAPPAEVDASLRVYVARLRRVLAAGNGTSPALETRGNGYVLRVAPETVDLVQFETLLASGSKALAAGRPAEAATELTKALALWRGPALGDLAEVEWAQHERLRLEGLRLRALEERIEADLAAGRHADVVAELEALVAADPCREVFVRQLMLALYRCGRQRDALQAYADARRALADGFGIEPTRALRELQRAILQQDPELDPPSSRDTAPAVRAGRSRHRTLFAATGGMLVLAGAVFVAVTVRGSGGSASIALAGNSVVAIDAKTNEVVGEVPIGGRPSGIAFGFGSVWAGNVDDNTLLRIDPHARDVVETIGLGVTPRSIAVGGGSVWVLSSTGHAVLEVDPVLNEIVGSIALPTPNWATRANKVAFARGTVWVAVSPPGMLVRIDPKTHEGAIHSRDVSLIASTARALWGVVWFTDGVRRVEPPGETVRLDRLGSSGGVGAVVADDRGVWIGSLGERPTLWRVSDIGRVTASVPLGHPLGDVVLGERAMWIVTRDGFVLRVDPDAGRVVTSIALFLYSPDQPGTIADGGTTVWVATLAR